MQPLLEDNADEKNLEQRIGERLGDFDLISLLRLLKSEGIEENAVWFSSHNSIASQKSLIESLRIVHDQAFIDVNIGILAPTGILPSYIRQFMDRPDVDDQGLQHLFKLFDHLLISTYLSQLYPEINRCFFHDWQKTKRCYTELQNMRCESSLHWLFETAFPEFSIKLIRLNYTQRPHKIASELGQITLGENVKPSVTEFNKDSFKVLLYLRPELISTAFNWSEMARERLAHWIFPWLCDFSMYLEIHLFTRFFGTHLKLFNQSALGYDPFIQSNKNTASHTHQWQHHNVIFAGKVPTSIEQKHRFDWQDSGRIRV